MISDDESIDGSALVVAHPDDEILWFSSVLARVQKVIICFLEVASQDEITRGRRGALAEMSAEKIYCLGLQEAETYGSADWPRPAEWEFGVRLRRKKNSMAGLSLERYRENYIALKSQLREQLRGVRQVFTHNPWGEYGHEEHVQVFRAVHSLRKELGYSVRFSNYVSEKSIGLFTRHLRQLRSSNLNNLKTNRELTHLFKSLYMRHRCWTWFENYEWPEAETFLRLADEGESPQMAGSLFPANFVDLNWSQPAAVTTQFFSELVRRVTF